MMHTSGLFSVGRAMSPAASPDVSGSIVDDRIGGMVPVAPLLGDDHSPTGDDDIHLGL